MKVEIFLGVLLTIICTCQSSTLVVDVVEIRSIDSYTFVCNVTSSTNLTRWTYLSEPNGTSLMSYQNGTCIVSPTDSFLHKSVTYMYACNSTAYQVTVKISEGVNQNNNILTCKNAHQLNTTVSTWIIKIKENESCSYCQPTISFDVIEITEGDNATFVCSIPSNVSYVNWNRNIGENTTAMNVSQNGNCNTTTGKTFLDNTSKYYYTCNQTVYQVTVLNVTRSEHNDMFMCTPVNWEEGTGSNWILKVKAQVTSVSISTPRKYDVTVNESTTVVFTCITSTARPAASVYWYRHPLGKDHDETLITDNITTTTDYNDLSVTTSILRLFVTRPYNDAKILCKANNTVNTTQLITKVRRLLNVSYDPYIVEGSEYHVIENTPGTLSCSAKGGNAIPTLSWSCSNFSPTHQSTINFNGNVTTTLTWNVSRTHDGTCTCTSQQTSFTNKTVDVSVVVLYPPSKPSFKANGINVTDDIFMVEGKPGNITCMTEAKPLSTYTWIGPIIEGSINIQTLTFNVVTQNRTGQYNCTVNNTMDRSIGDSIAGINSAVVNVIVLYPPVVTKMNNISKFEGEELNKTCPFTVGLPNKTAIKWIKDYNKSEWNDAELHILSLEKNDTGLYTCNASNVMNPSADNNSYTGHDAESFYLDVLYEAKINSFIIEELGDINVTVDENYTVNFICNADSNPTAVMTLRRESKILLMETSNNVEYKIVNASCLDAGTYYCSAKKYSLW